MPGTRPPGDHEICLAGSGGNITSLLRPTPQHSASAGTRILAILGVFGVHTASSACTRFNRGKSSAILVVNRWIAPGSEFRVHRQWFVDSAMDELLGVDFAVADKDRLYRCLDRLLAHKPDLFIWLRQQWADLFHADFEVLLYDLTSTYFEGEMEANPKGSSQNDLRRVDQSLR